MLLPRPERQADSFVCMSVCSPERVCFALLWRLLVLLVIDVHLKSIRLAVRACITPALM